MSFVSFVDLILPPPFAAVLLAGGRSTRMGRDKAGVIVGGQPLWQLQLAKLRALAPAEIFISGRADGPYSEANVAIVTDAVPDCGPLGGIAATLQRAASPWLLVLAIDLPDVSEDLLTMLVAEARARDRGTVPQTERGFEPLAAVYPRAALPFAEETLRADDRSMQTFVRRLLDAGLANAWPLTVALSAQFRNVNTPADL